MKNIFNFKNVVNFESKFLDSSEMSAHKSAWRCIRVINDIGTTISCHPLDNAGRLAIPFQKQKPRNLHFLIEKLKPNKEEFNDNDHGMEELNSIFQTNFLDNYQVDNVQDPSKKFPPIPFPNVGHLLPLLDYPSQPPKRLPPPPLHFYSVQKPISPPEPLTQS